LLRKDGEVRGLFELFSDHPYAFEERDLIALERDLHVFVEPSLQAWAMGSHFLIGTASWLYVNSQTTITVGALLYIYTRHNSRFYFVRNMFMIAMAIALVGYAVFPTAPPRFLPEYDNVLLAHADRTRINPEGHSIPLPPGNGAARGTVLIDGAFRATWRVTRERAAATLHVEPLARISRAQAADVRAEGRRLLAFVAPEAGSHHVLIGAPAMWDSTPK